MIGEIKVGETPTVSGVYLGKTSESFQWWNLVIVINGDAPFLRMESVYDRAEGKHCAVCNVDDVAVWSEKIAE